MNMEGLSQNEKIVWNCWEDKSPRDVVREAAAKGTHINLAIKYLKVKNSWSESTARDWFMAEVKAWTVQLLMRKQIFKVLHILNKCNINPEEHLMTLAKSSAQIEYRDFIVEHLQKLTKDMNSSNISKWDDFKRHWNLLRYLEKSFEVDGTFKQNKVFGIGNDRVFVNETEIKSLTIEKIEKYSPEWKCKIGTALFFDTFEFSLLDLSSPVQMWNYLVEHNKSMILVRWINVQMSEVVRDMNARYNFFNNDNFVQKLLNVDTRGFQNEVLDTLDEVFRKWPISEEMIQKIATCDCFEYTKMCIYDTLSSYGIIVEKERKDLYQIIARLSRTQNLKLIDDIFSESCATMGIQEFYLELAKYYVKNKLYKVLTICIEGHILDIDLSEIEQDARDCIELWLLFKSIEQTSDRQSHVVPVYKTCQQIAKDDIDNYISSNPHLVLGMILLEDNANLFDIFTKEEFLQFKDFKLPNKGYKRKLPHLYNIYKKHSSENSLYECKDVNVYQLLSGYRGLDVSKIFEFQIINMNPSYLMPDKTDRRSLGSLLSNEVDVRGLKTLTQKTIDMPDFANEKLMKRYGYDAKLNHVYYLKQYRPCNASQAFVSQQYQTYNRLQEKSIKSACCEAHALALQNWNDPAMTACAISFVAMIGCNPTRCRVHISATKMIKDHLISQKGLPENEANKIINEFMTKLIQNNDDTATIILRYLEEITLYRLQEIQEAKGKFDMSVVLYESQTMVKFAILHNLPLPEMQLKQFVRNNSWFNFLLFGDVFRYPLSQMLQLSQEFEKKSYSEHLKHIMMHRTAEDDKEQKSNSSNGQRRIMRLNSIDTSPTQSVSFDFPSSTYMGRELWEVVAACHGPEDPPAALLRAADVYREPLLVLVASCYEPNAVDVLWAHWILSSLEPNARSREALQAEIAQNVPAQLFQRVAEICLAEGYVATLYESILIFMPESPLQFITSFLYRSVRLLVFDSETKKYLSNFLLYCHRRYSVDANGLSYEMSKESMQRLAVSLIKIALIHNFDMAFHQKEFLKCLAETRFAQEFIVPTPNFATLYEIFEISMSTSAVMNISKMLQEDAKDYFIECVQMYTRNKNYDVALKIAKLAELPVDEILIAEWEKKCSNMLLREEAPIEDEDVTFFVAQCSEAFKDAGVTLNKAVDFLSGIPAHITKRDQKFYAYRIIMGWFEENHVYGEKREQIEHEMWYWYALIDPKTTIFLNDYQGTLKYILNNQKEPTASQKMDMLFEEKSFSQTLHEIEVESDVMNIERVEILEEQDDIDRWQRTINKLLELKLLVEAFRLSVLFKVSNEYMYRIPACPVQIMRTCLRLAEGTCSPYELPQELRLVISSPTLQNKLTVSEASETSFEELVVIQERQDGESVPHLAVREEADRLSALDALAVKSGLSVAKQVANYFRIALQIGWDYISVLKYQSRPLDFINLVSGRARMSLANLVFRTFNIPSKQIAEYLCREMVAAIISPHLVKTSTFRQKEHFQYTLWGYVLDSDIEMFLNMRPDACSHIGRLILDHLIAFQKIYNATNASIIPENTLDDSCLDVETLIDEEYQNVEGDEVESILTEEGTLMSAETESVYSVSTVYTAGNKMSRDSRRNLFDVISRSNVHIRYEVKSNIRKITKGAKLSTKQVNIISIELLVVAHECFSCACDTEGVGVALRSAQALAARLLAARSWRLMVRLLTGLARYTECAYILQALRDNHQFEFLLGQFDYMLGQQQDKIAEFKHGLLDFLKTHCPGDTDTYIMVALHFNMYAEAANVKKKQALNLIHDLEKMASDSTKTSKKTPQPVWYLIHDNVSTRSLLETALNHCTDACELYLQGGCTGFAGEMATLAQQIALQISLLNASPTRLILNRSTEQTYNLVSEYLSFMEGLVLLSSGGGSIWRELAYRRVLTNDQVYIRDMAIYRPDIAHDFLNRYKSEKKKTPTSQSAIAELRTLIR
ncbi:spatacsin isoform X3 [Vanessa cardui]|uniref:spatacsin isoform X3 n=1 Tax=Vanessa cardui TaxID=171605 RepID=UPI001F13267A|nr:spatacsin isoform X3 [Vanessa cardui]